MQQRAFPAAALHWTDERIRSLNFHSLANSHNEYLENKLNGGASNVPTVKPIEYAETKKSDLDQHAKSGRPLAIHLSLQSLERLINDLQPFYGVSCPVAIVLQTARTQEQVVRGTLETISLFQPPDSTASIYVLVG